MEVKCDACEKLEDLDLCPVCESEVNEFITAKGLGHLLPIADVMKKVLKVERQKREIK